MYDARLAKIRRQLNKLGYSLCTYRKFGISGYMIYDPNTNFAVAWSEPYGLSLEDVEKWLSDE